MTQSVASTLRNAKLRGKFPSGRLRFPARPGVTLVELLISMLILAIVCVAWLKIIGIQSARKEARRREAVERLSGMMDAFMHEYRNVNPGLGSYRMEMRRSINALSFVPGDQDVVYSVFEEDVSPIGYRLRVVEKKDLPDASGFRQWPANSWLVGSLYDRSGTLVDAGQAFFTLPVCLWRNGKD